MCYNYNQPEKKQIKKVKPSLLVPEMDMIDLNGFTHPFVPVIINSSPDSVTLSKWGLLPMWAKDVMLAVNTLNARIETLNEKPSFRYSVKNRCLILANGFYEWQWMDEKGKVKQKHYITNGDDSLMVFGGIYSDWTDPSTGELIRTHSIVTTDADAFMAEIHNTKKRMPVILTAENESDWLNGVEVLDFAKPVVGLTSIHV